MILIAFTALGWTLFVSCVVFYVATVFMTTGFHRRCDEAGLCSKCLYYRDPITRTLAEMINEDTKTHKARVENKSDEHKA